MGKDIIDQNIKDQLHDYVSYIDNDELWSAINKKRKSNRGGLYLMTFGALMLLAFAAYYFMSSENITSVTETVVNNTSTVIPIENTDTKTEQSTKVVEYKESPKETTAKENTITTKSKIIEKTTTNQTESSQTIVNKKTKLNHNKNSSKNSFENTTKAKTSESFLSKETNSENIVTESAILTSAKQELPPILMDKQEIDNETNAFSEISLLDAQSLIINRSVKTPNRKMRETQDQLGCYSHKRKVTNLSLFAYSGPEFISRSLSTQSTNPETTEYLEARKDSEIILQGARSGVMVKFNHRSGIYAKLGIEYQRLNERLNFMTMRDSSYVIPNQLIKVDIDSNGDSILTYGPVPVTVVQSKTWINYNKYHFVNIPLLIGYQKEIEKWSFGAELGITFNNKMSFSGMILSDTQSPIDDPNYFRNSIGISINGGLGVGYQIAPKYKIWATPSIKYDLSKVNQETYPIDQKYRTVGLLAGLELLF